MSFDQMSDLTVDVYFNSNNNNMKKNAPCQHRHLHRHRTRIPRCRRTRTPRLAEAHPPRRPLPCLAYRRCCPDSSAPSRAHSFQGCRCTPVEKKQNKRTKKERKKRIFAKGTTQTVLTFENIYTRFPFGMWLARDPGVVWS